MSNRFADYDKGIYPSKTTSQKSFEYNVKPGADLDSIKSNRLKKKRDEFYDTVGFEPTYTSGYRSQEEQDALPTTDKNKYSKHTLGLAYDQRVKDLTPEQIEKAIQYYKQDPNINAFVHEGTGRHLHIEDIGDTQLEAIKKRTSGNRFAEFDNLLTPKQPQVPEGPGLLSSAKDNVLKGLLNIGKFGNKVYDAIPSLNQNPALVDTETFRPSLDPRPDAFKSLYANDPREAITQKPIISEDLARDIVHGATALTPYGAYRSLKKGDVSPIAKGLESFGAKTISSFSTPESIVTAAGMATPAAPALLAGMTPHMVKGSFDEVEAGKQALQSEDKEAATEHFANAILNTGMAAGGVFGLGRMATPKISKTASMQEIKDATIPPQPPQAPTVQPNPFLRETPQQPKSLDVTGINKMVDEPISKSPTLPESPQTIDIQMQALAEGRVPAVMVTKGAKMPQVSEGFKVHNTELGEFIYDPMILAPEEIQARVDLGEHGQLLGHLEPKSPKATQTVAAIMPDGTEAKTSIVSPENIEPQAAILKQEFPQAEIKVGGEDLASQVLDTRRANNGGIKLRSGIDPIEAFRSLKKHLNKEKEQLEPIFYSKLQKTLEEKMPNSTSAEQVRGIVRSNGIKPEEIEWSGLEEYLKDNPKVTKQELLKHLKENEVHVEEVVKGDFKDEGPGSLQQARTRGESTKFHNYQTPGGENYRELLLKLPDAKLPLEIKQNNDGQWGLFVGDKQVGNPYPTESTARIAASSDQHIINALGKARSINNFYSTHFNEPNILAHVRFNDRVIDGKKTLFVEEIQSDWHQKGRKEGYGEKGVPNAPFKKTWYELAMKRIMRYAADKGYDRVAWTSGEQQAARYDLSKQVHKIIAIKNGDKFEIHGVDLYGNGHDFGIYSRDKLPDVVGKDLAEKITAQTTPNDVYAGNDLKVGGEGMKGFYDKILPESVNKMVKKHGGKVGEAAIQKNALDKFIYEGPELTQQHLIEANKTLNNATWEKQLRYVLRAMERGTSFKESMEIEGSPGLAEKLGGTLTPPKITEKVHSIDLNPQMKEAVTRGQPLYSGVDPIRAYKELKQHLKEGEGFKGGIKNPSQEYVKEMVEKREASREALGTSKLKGIYKQAKSDLVDFASPIEDTVALAQKKYGYEILPKYDVTNQIDRSLRSHTLAGKFIEDSKLPDVIQKVDNIDALDQYLIARHAKTLEGKGIKTGRDSAKDTSFLEANKAKYEPMAREVTKYSRDLLNYAVESGLISKDLATRLNNIYPDYVPFKRIFNELEKQHGIHTTKAVASLSKQNVVQKIKGSSREIDSPIATLLEKTYDAFAQGEKNKAAKILAEHKDLPGFEGLIEELPKGESAPHTFSYLDKGVKRTFKTTPEIAAAAKALDVQQLNILGKILAAPVRVAKLGITGVNLPFVLSNIVRDQMTGFLNSQHGLKTSAANPVVFIKALLNAVKHGELYDDMVRNAAGGTSFDLVRNQPVKTLNKIRSGKSLKSKIAYSVKNPSELFRALENIIGRSEELGRLQQFGGTKEALLKEGRTLEDANILASKAARENTANFYRRGNYGKVLNGAFLYLNAGIQGSRALIRAIERSPVKTSAKIATAIYLPMTMLTLWNLSDPKRKSAYEDIEDFEKENNLIYIPDNPTMNDKGQWNVIKMPLPPGVASIAIPVRRFIEQANGMDKVKFGEMAQALIGSVSPIEPDTKKILSSITPQAIKPTLEAQTNMNFFTGKPIVPASLSKKPKRMQVYPWTSGTAKKIADLTDSSPIQVEQFIKGTFGGLGAQGLNLSDRTLAELGLINEKEIGGQDVLEAIVARFNAARGGKKKRLFYEKKKEIESRL